jgi:multisubunit Na+/H+ antiporter MnhF subunit
MPSSTLLRAALALTATGIVSAATVRHALEEGGDEFAFAVGYAFYLTLILIATPRHPPRWAPALGFMLAAITYLLAITALSGNTLAMDLYLLVALLGYVATPATFRPLAVAAFALWTPAIRFFGPDPLAGEFPPLLAFASVLSLINLVAALLDRSARDPDERLRRIGLSILAVATVATVVERHLVVESRGIAPDDVMALVTVGVLPLLAVVRLRTSARDAIATGLALATFVLAAMALLLGKGYHVDAVTAPHVAAQQLLAGNNPYVTFDLPTALAQFGMNPELVTHYEDGTILRSLNYPALNFLLVAPFIALGVTDVRWIYLGEILVLVFILLRKVRIPWRPLVSAGVVGNTVIVRQNILAGVDPTWWVFMTLAWIFVESRWFSPIAVGLAVASRQPAWFGAPFYLLAIWKRSGRAEAVRRLAIVAVVALAPNLPFILANPVAFFDSVSAPMLGALSPGGIGFVRLALGGPIPLLPRAVYGGLAAVSAVALLAILWRYWRRVPIGAVIFPFVPLYLAWRSLQNYFGSIPLLAMAGDDELIVGTAAERREQAPSIASVPLPVSATSGVHPTSTAL